MLTVIMMILDVLVLVTLTMDYVKTKDYEEELNGMKGELRKLHYEMCEVRDQLRSHIVHG